MSPMKREVSYHTMIIIYKLPSNRYHVKVFPLASFLYRVESGTFKVHYTACADIPNPFVLSFFVSLPINHALFPKVLTTW